jgi:hypothetical protein
MSGWIRSQKAFVLFRYSAWAVVCMGLFMASMMTSWFWQIAAMPKGMLLLRILRGTAGLFGGPASFIILFGMMAFCAREDNSSRSTKVLWFIFFFFTAPFGTTIYFFSVYRKRVIADGYMPVGAR